MKLKRHHFYIYLWLACILFMTYIISLMVSPARVQAQDPDPPRHNTSAPSPSKDLNGAYIELQVQHQGPNIWTIVQWQDSLGNWHNVDGWQGEVDADGYKRWWVEDRNFGAGPYRWIVREGQAGPILGISEQFFLPSWAGEVVVSVEKAFSQTVLDLLRDKDTSIDTLQLPKPAEISQADWLRTPLTVQAYIIGQNERLEQLENQANKLPDQMQPEPDIGGN